MACRGREGRAWFALGECHARRRTQDVRSVRSASPVANASRLLLAHVPGRSPQYQAQRMKMSPATRASE